MTTELETFTDYCLSFYGEDGIYADDFAEGPLTRKEIVNATNVVLAKCEDDSVDNYTWGGGDSLDRERVAEEVDRKRTPVDTLLK